MRFLREKHRYAEAERGSFARLAIHPFVACDRLFDGVLHVAFPLRIFIRACRHDHLGGRRHRAHLHCRGARVFTAAVQDGIQIHADGPRAGGAAAAHPACAAADRPLGADRLRRGAARVDRLDGGMGADRLYPPAGAAGIPVAAARRIDGGRGRADVRRMAVLYLQLHRHPGGVDRRLRHRPRGRLPRRRMAGRAGDAGFMAAKGQGEGQEHPHGHVYPAHLPGRPSLLRIRAFDHDLEVFHRHAADRPCHFGGDDQLFLGRKDHSVQYLVGHPAVGIDRRRHHRRVYRHL